MKIDDEKLAWCFFFTRYISHTRY